MRSQQSLVLVRLADDAAPAVLCVGSKSTFQGARQGATLRY